MLSRYRVRTLTLFGSKLPATDPEITASALSMFSDYLIVCTITLNNDFWSHSIMVSMSACHAVDRGSIPLGTASFKMCVAVSPP